MPSLRSVAALAALAVLATASPIQKRGSFTLNQVYVGTVKKHGAQSMANTYTKFNGAMPVDVAKAAAGNGTGSVITNPGDQYDSLYLTPVTVGGTELMLDFDTGSADLWCFSDEQSPSETQGHAIYKTDASKKIAGASWKIQYGDGSGANGDVYADDVTVGGVTATKQAVEAAQSVSAQFARNKQNDGLLGLAFSTINTVRPQRQTTWFDTAVKEGLLNEPIIGVKLGYHKPGKYDFGFADTASYTGSVAYTDVDSSRGFWELTTDGYAVGEQTSNTPIQGIADTGTTLVYLDPAIVADYYSQVDSAEYNAQAGGYTLDCDAALPDFSLVISGETRTTPGQYVSYAPVQGNTCFGGIQRNTGLQGLSIFGDVFLKSQYVIHDAAAPRIGFAQQA